MKFKLVEHPRFWWPMTVRVPDPETAGAVIEQRLEVLLQARPQDELVAEQKRLAEITDPLEQIVAERTSLSAAIHGWRDVVDDDGSEIPFTAEALNAAMQHSWFRAGLHRALAEALAGKEAGARVGN